MVLLTDRCVAVSPSSGSAEEGGRRAPMPCRRGLTLLELVVVVAILAILIGFIVPVADYAINESKRKVTNANLVLIRDAIMGTQDKPGFLQDTGRLPITLGELFVQPTNVPAWNRDTGLGWRGPYVVPQGQYLVNPAANFFVYSPGSSGYPGTGYGTNSDPAVLDGWQRPIVLQVPNQSMSAGTYSTALAADLAFARLVSAGQNGIIDTDPNYLDSNGNPYPPPQPGSNARIDDIILFLSRQDSNR